jgi:hypothetical protein
MVEGPHGSVEALAISVTVLPQLLTASEHMYQEVDWLKEQSLDPAIAEAITSLQGKIRPFDATQLGPITRKLLRKKLRVVNGILYRIVNEADEKSKCLVLPCHWRKKAFDLLHCELGHPG